MTDFVVRITNKESELGDDEEFGDEETGDNNGWLWGKEMKMDLVKMLSGVVNDQVWPANGITALQGGMTNLLFKCTSETGFVVVVRVEGVGTEQLVNRSVELEVQRMMGEQDLAPKIFGTFQNGYVMEYCDWSQWKHIAQLDLNEEQLHKMGIEIARFHEIGTAALKVKSEQEEVEWASQLLHHGVGMSGVLKSWLELAVGWLDHQEDGPTWEQLVENGFPQDCANKEWFRDQLEWVLDQYNTLVEETGLLMSHNDINARNVMWSNDESKIMFLDYEYTNMGVRAFDIGNFFCEFPDALEDTLDWSQVPDKEKRELLLNGYASHACENTSDDVQDLVNRLHNEVELGMMFSHFMWGLWSVIQQKNSTLEWNFLGYGASRLTEFIRLRGE